MSEVLHRERKFRICRTKVESPTLALVVVRIYVLMGVMSTKRLVHNERTSSEDRDAARVELDASNWRPKAPSKKSRPASQGISWTKNRLTTLPRPDRY